MNKFGIIFCGYNNEDTVEKALEPFLDDDRFVVAAVSVPFAEYIDQDEFEDGTGGFLNQKFREGEIKYFIDSPRYIKEHEARNLALDCLKREECQYYCMADGDELITKEQIENIIQFIEKDSESVWWRLSLKNYVFDDKTYLKEPFCPPRIFRAKPDYLYNPSFYGDNDIQYFKSTGEPISYLYLPNQTVPKETAWIKHLTWLNNKIGKRKVGYQTERWGENSCSFDWDEEKGLHFNEEYFRMKGERLPETLTDNQ